MFLIYCHTNKIDNKRYIGMTNDIKRRWRQSGSEYKSATCFYNAINKIGWDNFTHEILEQGLTESEARVKEIYYINLYDTTNPAKGYNIDKGGRGGRIYKTHPRNMLGKHQSQYQKDKQTTLMSNSEFNPMKNGSVIWGVTHNHPKGMQGKHHTDEHNSMISLKMKEKNVNCKAVKVVYPDGKVETYRSTTDAQNIGLTKPVILKIIRSGKPYKIKVINQHTDKVKHLEGIMISYLEDTEVNDQSKK